MGSVDHVVDLKVDPQPRTSLNNETGWWVVTYIVNSENEHAMKTDMGNEPVVGDPVWINTAAGLTDLASNIQNNASNRRVPLEIVPGPIKWIVKIKNNPSKGGDPNRQTQVILTPSAKGGQIPIEVNIKLFSSMGNLVKDTTLYNRDKQPGLGENEIVWTWKGDNMKGRTVGTGTYLFKAVCTAIRDQKQDRNDVQRSIGFVRGKN
jgi:hypothetical protein